MLNSKPTKYSKIAVTNECNLVKHADHYSRRNQLLSSSCSLYELVAGGNPTEEYVRSSLIEAGVYANIPLSDTRRMIEWGKQAGMQNPRSPSPGETYLQDISTRRSVISDWYQIAMSDPSIVPAGKIIIWAVSEIAFKSGKTRVDISIRQLSLASGLNLSTVQQQYKTLGNYLSINKRGTRTKGAATTWQICLSGIPVSQFGGSDNRTCRRLISSDKRSVWGFLHPGLDGDISSSLILNPTSEIWVRKKTAWLIYHSIMAGSESQTKPLAKWLGISNNTVRHNLRFLVEIGLIQRMDDDTHEPIVLTDLDLSALIGGERSIRMAERYSVDRKAFKVWQQQNAEVIASAMRRQKHKEEFSKVLKDSARIVKPVSELFPETGDKNQIQVLNS